MLIVPIDNYQQYESKLKFFMSTVMTAGASVFRGLEEENIFAQGFQITTKAAYYSIAKEEGSA